MLAREIVRGFEVAEAKSFGAPAQPLTMSQLQVKALDNKAKQYKDKAKTLKATQRVQKAQTDLAKKNQQLANDQQQLQATL